MKFCFQRADCPLLRGVAFVVRQGAVGGAHDQGVGDRLFALGNLAAAVYVEQRHVLQNCARRAADCVLQRRDRDGILDDYRDVTGGSGEFRQGLVKLDRLCAVI